MGWTLSDARNASYWEYTAVLTTLNARRKSDGGEDVAAPTADQFQRNAARIPLAAMGRA